MFAWLVGLFVAVKAMGAASVAIIVAATLTIGLAVALSAMDANVSPDADKNEKRRDDDRADKKKKKRKKWRR